MTSVKMGEVPFELNAQFKGDDGSLAPFYLKIDPPKYDEDRGFFCPIICPYIQKKELKIFGYDEAQAIELSFQFIRLMLKDGHRVIGEDGEEIVFPSSRDDGS